LKATFIILLLAAVTLSSCSVVGNLQGVKPGSSPKQTVSQVANKPRFLPNLTEATNAQVANSRSTYAHKNGSSAISSGSASTSFTFREDLGVTPNELNYRPPFIETASPLQLKYALLLNAEVEDVPSENLLSQIEDWYGVRYRSGGNTKKGIDCSAFTMNVYQKAFCKEIPRTSREQFKYTRRVSLAEIKEGDLVFFNIRGRGVSHVGVYLGNNKFAHASVSQGVMVSDLTDPYYSKKYLGAGRVEQVDQSFAAGN
jgi:lipoprotein Spr